MSCPELEAYFADALAPEARAVFERHLVDCQACGRRLLDLMVVESLAADAVPAPVIDLAAARRRRLRPLLFAVAAGVAAAAALTTLVVTRAGPAPLALAGERGVEPRLLYPPADRHRPYAVSRGGDAAEAGLVADLPAEAEARAAVLVLAGAPERVPATAAASDRAAALLVAHQPLPALVLLAGAAGPQAGWNRSLALRDLGLPAAAAVELDAVAALAEPGWADEARVRATALRDVLARRAAAADTGSCPAVASEAEARAALAAAQRDEAWSCETRALEAWRALTGEAALRAALAAELAARAEGSLPE